MSVSLPLDSVQNVSHIPEDHLQAAAGGRISESAGRAGDGVSTEPGLHGNNQRVDGFTFQS